MKKTLLVLAATLSFSYANAQMKLGSNPTTTNSNALLEMETTNKGLLLPRVALTSTTAFAPLTAHVAGMAVYNTATAGDVTPGYYFDNGTKWVRVADANASVSNLYTADGTLTGARTVTMGANNLSFTGTGKIGMGTVAPETQLHVVAMTSSGNRFNMFDAPQGTTDHVISAFRNTSVAATGNKALVGFTNNGPTVGGATWGIGSIRTATNEDFYFGNSSGGGYLERMRITSNGAVGIGTNAPAATLDVNGTTKTDALQVVTGAGTGKVLTSDAAGLATWQTPATGGSTLYNGDGSLSANRTVGMGTNNLSFTGTGKIGIGVAAPTQSLDVNAGALLRGGTTDLVLTGTQLLFGFNGTADYKHAIKTRHNNGQKVNNAIDFYVWDQGVDATTAEPTKRVMTIDGAGTGNVGIGTALPGAKLDIVGNIKIVDGTQGVGKVLTSDATGLASWATPTVSSNLYTADGTLAGARTVTMGTNNLSFNGAGNVAIGTTTPSAKLHVAGSTVVGTQTSATDGGLSIGANILNAVAPTKIATTAITASETALRLIKAGTSGTKYNSTADMQLGTYAVGLNAVSNLKFRLANGASNTPDVDVMTLQGNGNVGIGTSAPDANAALDVTATNKGFLMPRVALTSTTAFAPLTAHVAGMAVYNTATAGDVTPGYYFDNGTTWVRIADASASVSTLYNADGTLSSARTVTMGANNLSFTGTGKIGMGTVAPETQLHVVATTSSGNRFNIFDAPQAATDYVISTFRNTSVAAAGNKAFIGFTNNGPTVGGASWGVGSIRTATNEDFYIGNSLGGGYLERMRITSSGAIGIGTNAPTTKLEVVGTTKTDALQVVTGAGVGKVLTSDAAGVATWTTPANAVTSTKYFGLANTNTLTMGNLEFRYSSTVAGGNLQYRSTTGASISGISLFLIENWNASGYSSNAYSNDIAGTTFGNLGNGITVGELNTVYVYDTVNLLSYKITINLLNGGGSIYESLLVEKF